MATLAISSARSGPSISASSWRRRRAPGQAGQGLAARPVRHQGHRDHQPDDQRVRHDPPPLPRQQPALLQRRPDDRLDHAVSEVALQLAQPHEIRQPPVRQHAAVPPDHRRGRHHRTAEHRQLAARRPSPRRNRRLPAASLQVSGPHHDHPRRSPGYRGFRCPACNGNGRQIGRHQGSWKRHGLRHPKPYQEPSVRPNHLKPRPIPAAKSQVTASCKPPRLKSLVLAFRPEVSKTSLNHSLKFTI